MQPGKNSKPAPKPDNWHGVAEGLSRARQHTSDGLFQKAIDTLKEILEFAPSEPKVWRMLGDILDQHGHSDKAEACHRKAARFENYAVEQKPAPPASKRLATLLWSQGDCESARAMLAILMMRNPDDSSLVELRASWENEESR